VKKIKLDIVFPLYGIPQDLKHINKLILWSPDFHEKYFPNFFTEQDIISRKKCYEIMISSNHPIVFSSTSAIDDFNTFFPKAKNKKSVLRFAAIHPILDSDKISDIKEKYGINGNYFISPNQFWQHKNHIVIIEAVKILKNIGIEVKIIFTGKEYDYRNPNYVIDLKKKVFNYNLENQILFLGFIDRIDQLILMKNATAVIQPSLFEGWSTVVEDAKALNQTIIASNISVHKEQLENYAYYFNPINPNELAKIILELTENTENKLKFDSNYNFNISNFAQNFSSILNQYLNET
jgi:glycosyltransferase involved in cell wall biosynthesis